jgi:hypothetical protein
MKALLKSIHKQQFIKNIRYPEFHHLPQRDSFDIRGSISLYDRAQAGNTFGNQGTPS